MNTSNLSQSATFESCKEDKRKGTNAFKQLKKQRNLSMGID